MSGIEVHDLSVRYGRVVALEGVSLSAPAGTITGVVGPNGAGKSSLLGAIIGEVRPSGGHVVVGGVRGRPPAGSLAYLPQRSVLDRDYPVQAHEVVDMGRTPLRRPWRRRRTSDRRAVADALERVGLSDLATAPFGHLSGGQQQRVLLARSLAQEADHLLLDEPFVGIDAATVGLLETVLRERAAAGATVVVVDHGLERLRGLCDRMLLVDRRTIAVGDPRRVLTSEVLARAFAGSLGPVTVLPEAVVRR